MRFLTTFWFLPALVFSFVSAANADVLLNNTNVYAPDSLSFDQLGSPDWVTGAFFRVAEDAQISNLSAIFGTSTGASLGGGYTLGVYEVVGATAVLIPQSVVEAQIPTWDQVLSGDVKSPDFFDTWATVADYSNNSISVQADSQYIFGIVSQGEEFPVGALAHVGHPITSNGSQLTRITAEGFVDFSDENFISQALLRIDGSFEGGLVGGGIQNGSAIPEPGSAFILFSIVGWAASVRRR